MPLDRRVKFATAAAVLVGANAYARRRGYTIPGRTRARCSQGHEFTTLWIVGVSLTSLRLTPLRRVMRCPECRRWRLVRALKPEPAEAGA